MKVTKKVLTGMGVSASNATKFLPQLNKALPQHDINTPLRIAHFLAQVVHESNRMKAVRENMNYSAKRLLEVFGKYFTRSQAKAYARKPKKIGSRVYANRMGNGNETSGDGYRYRGRGLIQLTGKSNYRKFSTWMKADVLKNPGLVADEYPVYSAVYYWETRNINALADIDDVRAVTKKINGGYHGLQDRIMLLDKAKALLAVDDTQITLEGATHRVIASSLNLRSKPKVTPSTKIGTLSEGTKVAKVKDANVTGWVLVRVQLNGQITEGYVAGRYLQSLTAATATKEQAAPKIIRTAIPPAHLKENRTDITRKRNGGRAYPLGEAGKPKRTATSPETKAKQLIEIVNYLDSEKKSHKRYQKGGGNTYCNIYATDYCYLANVYLPRVWWTDKALQHIRASHTPAVKYGKTVRELNANALQDWFEDFGADFGWRVVSNLDILQAAANNGEVCIIVAKRKNLNRSGHIVAVVPEHGNYEAARSSTGEVRRPLESQAGSTNYRFITKSSAWWTKNRFQSFSFWRHS